MQSLDACHALVLNADFRPLSYFPLSLMHWQDTVKAVFLDRVSVLSEYDRAIRSPAFEMRLPSVVALKDYVPSRRSPAFTRFHVFLRDKFTCQYCGQKFPTHELTFDHVVPRMRGGKSSWDNVVTACSVCNARKGSMSVAQSRMQLLALPRAPSMHELQNLGRSFPPNSLHISWRDYLYWDLELES